MSAVYHELDFRLDYHPDTHCVDARADFARVARGVGGAIAPHTTRETTFAT